jgi:hypothetical protein
MDTIEKNYLYSACDMNQFVLKNRFWYYYYLVNVISSAKSQSDHIKQLQMQ